ncbi:hypothetical protein QG37_00871 [Candidozyma auris]|uniref:Uncharacterized protein n=1 Tax=Candidozyma auris TaxID=498019 RepID=A0A0L0P736_CANAR|nr:hypothetical protein QG37_00871 [[Candida] auris]
MFANNVALVLQKLVHFKEKKKKKKRLKNHCHLNLLLQYPE